MSDSSNVLGLSGDAEQALLKLALRFELITGMQLNWRQNAEAVENILALSESHSDPELRQAAQRLRKSLSSPESDPLLKEVSEKWKADDSIAQSVDNDRNTN